MVFKGKKKNRVHHSEKVPVRKRMLIWNARQLGVALAHWRRRVHLNRSPESVSPQRGTVLLLDGEIHLIGKVNLLIGGVAGADLATEVIPVTRSHQTDTEEKITEEAQQEILEVKVHVPTAAWS